MNINDLTIGQAKELAATFGSASGRDNGGLNAMVGCKCIVRTNNAGVWFGTVAQKSGNEVIITSARRMWQWKSGGDSISLSGVANHGIVESGSRIAEAVASVWLEAIELIPATDKAVDSIEGAKNAKAG